MKITGIEVVAFKYRSRVVADWEGHAHPGPEHDAIRKLTKIVTDEGIEGYCFGGDERAVGILEPILIGENPLNRERIWQRLRQAQRIHRRLLDDETIATIDIALWDFFGRLTNLPICKLLGGYREKVPAYGSTMCGDDIPGGLDSPDAYADFAQVLKEKGYPAIKLHTWMPPLGPDPERDVAACRAVRERVGPDIELMLDCWHYYSRQEALYIGRELEELNFHWFEEPMDEHSVSSYVWLAEHLDIPIVGPEIAGGKMYTRAEWILRNASDISRCSVEHGGITALVKAVHLCESFGIALEVHGGGPANLQVLGAMGIPGEYYERGLLHPMLNYGERTPWLREIIDPMDSQGYVHISQKPGLGLEIDWDFIERNRC